MSSASLFGLVIGLSIVLAAFLMYRWLSDTKFMDSIVFYGTWAMRLRYCLLLCLAPAGLGVVAWLNLHMLEALLLVRKHSALLDMFAITLISYFTVGVGLVHCHIVMLHGNTRFGKCPSPTRAQNASESVTTISWWRLMICAWWVAGLILPLLVAYTSIQNYRDDTSQQTEITAKVTIGIVLGWAFANAIGFLLAALENLLLEDVNRLAQGGRLPLESIAHQVVPRQANGNVIRRVVKWLFGDANHGFSWLFRGPGYTDSNGVLLPGHPQALILFAFCAATYFIGYFLGLSDKYWYHVTWATGFCAVLFLFLIGNFMSSVAFWLDYYGLPPCVFAVAYTVAVFYSNVSDHYFEIQLPPIADSIASTAKPRGSTNAYVEAATMPRTESTHPDETFEQLYLVDVLKDWPFPEMDGKKTLVVVTASGGGGQAAAWTTKVLTELDKEFQGFSQSIGLMSTVSGGSVGTMFYLGHRPIPKVVPTATAEHMLVDEASRSAITKPSTESALEGVAWGLVGPDFMRAIVPMASPPLIDRGWALESLWWNKMGSNRDDRQLMQSLTIRDLIPLIRQHRMPPMIFNATCVETGQRVLISPIHIAVARANPKYEDDWQPERALIKAAPNKRQKELVSTPIDFLDFYDAALSDANGEKDPQLGDANLRLSTAVRLSATFSYVTPVARPSPIQGFGLSATVNRLGEWIKGSTTELAHRRQRLNRHFCDGGYADNPGLVTAVRSVHDLLEYYRRENISAPFQQVLVIRIEPFPKTAAQHAKDNTGYLSAVHGPSAALSAMRVSTQAERGELELGLLEGPRYRNRRATQIYLEAVDTLHTIRAVLPEDDVLKSSLQDIITRAETSVESVLGTRSAKESKSLLPTSQSIEATINHIASLKPPAAYRQRWEDAQKQLNAAKDAISSSAEQLEDRDNIPVDSVTFRFEVYPADRNPSVKRSQIKEEPIEPPLTWTLTETQKKDLDRAWARIIDDSYWSAFYSGTADTISPKDIGKLFKPKSKSK